MVMSALSYRYSCSYVTHFTKIKIYKNKNFFSNNYLRKNFMYDIIYDKFLLLLVKNGDGG